MKCTSCGTENPEGSKFCKGCGQKLEVTEGEAAGAAGAVAAGAPAGAASAGVAGAGSAGAAQQPADSAQTQAQGQPQQAQPQNQTAGQAPQAPFSAQNQQSQPQPQVQYAQGSTFKPKSDAIDDKQYTASPFGSAWADISNSKNWFGRALLLGLCSIVPVLRWVVWGYANRWGREVCLGINRRMPESIFEEGTFVTGAKIFVCELAYSAIFFAAFFLLMLIPVLGGIVFALAFAVYIFVSPLLDFQIGLSGKISAGFTGIGRAFKLIKKTPVKTLVSTMGPALIVEALVGFVFLVILCALLLAFSHSIVTDSSQLVLSSASYSPKASNNAALIANSIFGAIAGLGVAVFLLYVVFWFACCVAGALSSVWSARAIGHLVSREGTEWLQVAGLVDLSNTDLPPNSVPTPFVPFQNR